MANKLTQKRLNEIADSCEGKAEAVDSGFYGYDDVKDEVLGVLKGFLKDMKFSRRAVDAAIQEALERMEDISLFLKVLGSYPKAKPL